MARKTEQAVIVEQSPQSATTQNATAPKGVIRVRSVSVHGFYRAGRRFEREWSTLRIAELSTQHLDAILQEAALQVERD